MARVLVAGAPRSGTTWVKRILASGPTTKQVHEPDNDLKDSFALRAKAGLGRFPVLFEEELPGEYRQLWDAALSGGQPMNSPPARAGQVLLRTARRSTLDGVLDQEAGLIHRAYSWAFDKAARPRRGGLDKNTDATVIAKTVHASFALEAITDQWPDVNVLIVRRNPLNAVASWLELGWKPLDLASVPQIREHWIEPDGLLAPSADASVLYRMAWDYCLLDDALSRSSDRNPDWHVVSHETICLDPVDEFRTMFGALGVAFTTEIEQRIRDANTAGDGYQTNRVAADQIHRWKNRLDEKQVSEIRSAAACFESLDGIIGP